MPFSARSVTLLLTLAGIYLLGWLIQDHVLFNWDVSWLTHAAGKLLAGGTYTKDFFELNPPLSLYLYLPVVITIKLFSLTAMTALRIYVYVLGTAALFLCYELLSNIFSGKDKGLFAIILLTLACVYFILPLEQFGQREHFLLMLTMPYLIGVACRLDNKAFHRVTAVLIGLFAGVGFATKPYFLVTLFSIECYCMVRTRNRLSWVRPEVVTQIAVVFVYLLLVFTVHRDYLDTVVPIISRLYYSGVGQSWWKLATIPPVLTCYFAIGFYILRCRVSACHTLRTVLVIALIGFLASYFLQHTIWYFHFYPAFSTACVLLVLEFGLFVSQPRHHRYDLFTAAILIVSGCLSMACLQLPWHTMLMFDPVNFFLYFTLLFAFVLYNAQPGRNVVKIIMILSVIMMISYLLTQLMLQTVWYAWRAEAAVLAMFVLFALLVPKTKWRLLDAMMTSLLGAVLFAYAFYFLNMDYDSAADQKEKLGAVIAYVHRYAENKPVMVFSARSYFTYPVIDYANALPAMRIPFLTWVLLVTKQSQLPGHVNNAQLEADKHFYTTMMVEDINANPPALILVDTQNRDPQGRYIDYIGYLSQDARFRKAWQSYHYVTTLEAPLLYKLDVYKRNG